MYSIAHYGSNTLFNIFNSTTGDLIHPGYIGTGVSIISIDIEEINNYVITKIYSSNPNSDFITFYDKDTYEIVKEVNCWVTWLTQYVPITVDGQKILVIGGTTNGQNLSIFRANPDDLLRFGDFFEATTSFEQVSATLVVENLASPLPDLTAVTLSISSTIITSRDEDIGEGQNDFLSVQNKEESFLTLSEGLDVTVEADLG